MLGLELQDGDELAAPDGLVRSRAARSADGSVRFALSVPLVGNGGSELQHVAFASDDVLAAAAGDARARRAAARDPRQLLRRPRGAHAASSPTTIERMRELGVLYDATGDGELLHFYTELIGPACSSRSSSGAAATTATAPPTRPFASPRTTPWALCRWRRSLRP